MKVVLLQDFTATTTAGPRHLPAGKVLDLAEDKAGALIDAGIAEPEDLPRPYLDRGGILVIPLNAPSRYRWWQGGQSAADTRRELLVSQTDEGKQEGGNP